MIGAAQLQALGSDGVLVNVGRGPLVDERALYDALLDGTIRGAAIDVWYSYPAAGRSWRAQRAAVRRTADALIDPALVGSHPGHLPGPRRRHRRQHRAAATRRAAAQRRDALGP